MYCPRSKMELDRLPPANQPAEVGQSRAGLLGFFRPQKTVSPWVQQGSQDLSSATRFCAMPVGRSTAENVQEICPESGSNSAWNNLPEHLIEAIMQMLQEDSPSSASVQHSNKQAIQTQFAATSVSQSWRQIGRRTFFKTLWDQSGAIKHPVQMFGLTPEGLPTQLVKCVVKREYDTARPKAVKYTLRLGDKIGQSSFMMTALQVSRLDMKIFLSSSCQGAPCAHIETNLLGTKYEVMLDRTVQPFAQHQRGHSDTPLVTHDNLPSAQSMHSMRSASCDLDVPVVDLPSTGTPHSSSAAPLLAEADLEPSSPVVEPQCIAQNGIPGDSHTNQQVNTPSPTASGSLLGRVKSARHSRTEAPVQSPFAAMAEGSTADLQAGANLPPLGSMSPASPSFLARYQSAKDSLIASRSSPSAKVPPTPTISPMSTSRIPGRSQSGKVGTNSLPQSSCGDPRCSCHVVPKSVGGIQYKARIHGFMRPRRMKVSLPDPMVLACFDTSASSSSNSHDTSGAQQLRGPTSLLNNPAFVAEAGPSGNSARRMADTAASSDQTPPPRQDPLPAASQSSQQLASGTSTPSQTDSLLPVSPRTPSSSSPKRVELRNKAPHWNDTLRCWCLNFRGRVKLASVKNFQLMKAEDPSKTIVMQFGKVDPYTYIMDYNPAEISTVQAFAISLSTFDTKLLL